MSTQRLLAKPLQGGLFGHDEYELATMPCVARGLHAVRYLVIQRRAGLVVSVADDKQQALADARRVIGAAGELAAANDEALPRQGELWNDLPVLLKGNPPAPSVSRRRREIFERTQGQCFYCSVPLQIAGPWHVEHQLPRALGGGEGSLNLVAACSACNLRKADRTAIEFVADCSGRGSR